MNADKILTDRQIPKVIHYCWFGKGEKPSMFNQCYESWKRYCPDYEIIEWNEDNIDVTSCQFMQDAYENKKYAFVSDVARVYVIYNYGGIYLDTDVELTAPIDEFRQNKSFFFFKNLTQIATGLGFGAEPENEVVKILLDSYNVLKFSLGELSKIACQNVNTQTISEHYPTLQINGTTQEIDGNCFISISEYNKIAKHYDAFSWKTPEQESALKYARKRKKQSKFRTKLQNPKIYVFFQKHSLTRLEKVYTFIVYDLFDYGMVYWLVRIKQKVTKLLRLK